MTLHSAMSSRSLGRLKDYSLGAAAIATGAFGLAPQEAGAAILQFSDSGSFYQGTHAPSGDQATITVNLGDGSQLLIDQDNYFHYLGFQVTGGAWDEAPSYFLNVLGAGAAITPFGNPFSFLGNAVQGYATYGGWNTAFTDQFIGFRTGAGNEGWMKVSWDPGTGLFSYNGGAIETTGADLLAGQTVYGGGGVAEPGSLALLVAGAVMLARRRRMTH